MSTASAEPASPMMSWGARALAVLVVFVPVGLMLVMYTRHDLNVDGIAYMRIADYYADGNYDLAVTAYWAPLLSWFMTPAELLGWDLPLAARVLNVLAGAVFICGVARMARLLGLQSTMATAVVVGSALLALRWLPRAITPDVLFAALLTLYLSQSYAMWRTRTTRSAAVAGLLAGGAYLAKYYALPFFVLHHSLTTLLLCREGQDWMPRRRQLQCWVVGLAACAVIAGPWITVLSFKHGRPMFATTGKYTHSIAGPSGGFGPVYALNVPRDGRIAAWENPDEGGASWPGWSPFAGVAGAVHQLRLFARNTAAVSKHLFSSDGLGLMYMALCALPVCAFMSKHNALDLDTATWRWSLVVVVAYLSGLMFVFAGSPRYYWPLQGLLLILVGCLAVALGQASRGTTQKSAIARRHRVFAVIIVCACTAPLMHTAREALREPGRDLRAVAGALRDLDVSGPLASNNWHHAMVLAYRLETPCVGVPTAADPQAFLTQLSDHGIKTFVMFKDQPWPQEAAHLGRLADALGTPAHNISSGEIDVRVYDAELLLASTASPERLSQ